MIILVDSGSTKSDWVLLDNNGQQNSQTTIGFNPNFHSTQEIVQGILENKEIEKMASQVGKVFYYGAACSTSSLKEVVENALKEVFIRAEISVESDLKACCLSVYTGSPIISCILGTGSNACYFDGTTMRQEVPALGYILGDEGSGTYFGKQLLSSFLYHKLPQHIEIEFIKEFQLNKELIVDRVYRQANANVYLASFTMFIAQRSSEAYFEAMIDNGFRKFLEIHVCSYPNYKEVETHFVGSVAYTFQTRLRKIASDLGINVGEIIQKPIDGLVRYHFSTGL